MSSNPFANYPFWHHFTLHLQNIPYMSDELRLIKLDANIVTFNSLNRTANADFLTNEQKKAIENAVFNSKFYDYQNDKIVDANSIDMNRVILIDVDAVAAKNDYIMNPKISNSRIQDPLFLVKKKGSQTGGGELYPVIGNKDAVRDHYYTMAAIIMHMIDSQKNPMPDLTSFNEQFKNLQNTNNLYQNPLIKRILESKTFFEPETQEVVTSVEKGPTIDFSKYRQQLINTFSSSIPSDKAIRINTGKLAKKSNNIIVRKRIKLPSPSKETKIVEFAYPSKITDSNKKLYEDYLTKNFGFEDVAETVVSESKKQSISITPITFTENTYSNIFGKDTGFRTYIKKENDTINYNPVDTTQSLQTLKKITEEIPEEEEYESEEEEYESEEVMSEDDI